MPQRKVIKHPQYELAVANIGEEFEGARKVIAGAEWSIRRSPKTDGIRIAKIDARRARVMGVDFPSHFIYCSFTDKTIKFLTIKPCDE